MTPQRTRGLLLALGALLALGLLTGCTPSFGWGMGGMMGPGHGGPGLGAGSGGSGTPLTMDQAIEVAQRYVSSLGLPGLELVEIMEFDNHFYVEAEEANTGVHAFEILIDRYSGAVHPEPGPNMMWNRKYGPMMGGMGMGSGLGWGGSLSTGPMPITPEQAREIAQRWLDEQMPGTTVSEEADAFYGYYTLHTLRDGQIVGMLSVNGYTGQVWPHTWHGRFLGMRTLNGDEDGKAQQSSRGPRR